MNVKKLSRLERYHIGVQLEDFVEKELHGQTDVSLSDFRSISSIRDTLDEIGYSTLYGKGGKHISIYDASDAQIIKFFQNKYQEEQNFMEESESVVSLLIERFPSEIGNILLMRKMLELRGKDYQSLDARIDEMVNDPVRGERYQKRVEEAAYYHKLDGF